MNTEPLRWAAYTLAMRLSFLPDYTKWQESLSNNRRESIFYTIWKCNVMYMYISVPCQWFVTELSAGSHSVWCWCLQLASVHWCSWRTGQSGASAHTSHWPSNMLRQWGRGERHGWRLLWSWSMLIFPLVTIHHEENHLIHFILTKTGNYLYW